MKSVAENVNTTRASHKREDGFAAASSACQGGFSLSPYWILLLTHYPNSIRTWIEPGTTIAGRTVCFCRMGLHAPHKSHDIHGVFH